MREALLAVVVAVICLAALFRPFIGLLGYLWFALLRPDILAFATGVHPFSLILAIVLLASSVRVLHRFPLILRSPLTLWFLAFQFLLLLAVLFAVDRSLSIPPYLEYLRIVLIPLLIPILVTSVEELRILILVVVFSVGTLGVKFGFYGILTGGAIFRQGYGGMLSDNNDMGLAFAMTFMLCWYATSTVSSRGIKAVLLFVAFSTAAGAIMTHSRGAALSLAAGFLLMISRSKHKTGMLILLILFVGPSIYLVRDSYVKRLSTVETYQDDSSAMSRIQNAKAGFAMWEDHPIFGVGFGSTNFIALSEEYGGVPGLVAHDTYIQTLADDGIFAFAVYVSILFGTIAWLGFSARRMRYLNPELAVYPVSLQTALVTFAVGSTFLSRLQFDLLYILLMCGAAWYLLERAISKSSVADSEGLPLLLAPDFHSP